MQRLWVKVILLHWLLLYDQTSVKIITERCVSAVLFYGVVDTHKLWVPKLFFKMCRIKNVYIFSLQISPSSQSGESDFVMKEKHLISQHEITDWFTIWICQNKKHSCLHCAFSNILTPEHKLLRKSCTSHKFCDDINGLWNAMNTPCINSRKYSLKASLFSTIEIKTLLFRYCPILNTTTINRKFVEYLKPWPFFFFTGANTAHVIIT